MLSNENDPALPMGIGANAAVGYSSSGVSWGAILAGAAAAAALSLILVVLGFGLGFSAVSPWPSSGAEASTVGISAAIWLALTQIAAAGVGGYLAGRLRVKWTDVHTDEVYFRDTAHGLLSWAVATIATAALLGSVVTGIVSTGAQAAGNIASSTLSVVQSAASSASKGGDNNSLSYFVDSLFRSDQPVTGDQGGSRAQSEAATVLMHSISTGTLDAQDKTYLAKLVAQHTGLSQADAEKRVDDLYAQAQQAIEQAKTKAKEAADAARKAGAGAALWTFVALLCGAFFASLAAIWGGRRRDMAVIDTATY
ncbi:hypothetical protein [Pollutimonas bauzanensis]|jgi:hypothetical protein|uniref:hypothetical protein n=1 Tax=Pollutimonas bauzanensis TaxID=658167 RepID=UPI0033426CB7